MGKLDQIEETLANNIKELIIIIENTFNNSSVYRKIITEFHENWTSKRQEEEKFSDNMNLWGSEVLIPRNYRIKDAFVNSLHNNVIKYFEENDINTISDLTEEFLLELMYYPSIGYMRFMDVLYSLFIIEFDYKGYELYEEIELEHDETEEVDEDMGNSAAIAFSGSIADTLIDSSNEIDIDLKSYDSSLNDNVFTDLLSYNKTLIENIEIGQDLIVKSQNSYNTLKSNLSYMKSKNENLKKQVVEISIQKEAELQKLREDMLELEKDKNSQIIKLNNTIGSLIKDKNEEISKIKDEMISMEQSHVDEIDFLNNNYDNFKSEKEEQINDLNQEISQLQAESVEDKKVLDEFQNMIKILEKIKGIFKKETN